MIRYDLLYCVNFKGKRIRFWADVDRFADELSEVFPSEKGNIHRFYRDMATMYHHVMVESPSYNTTDETDGKTALKSMIGEKEYQNPSNQEQAKKLEEYIYTTKNG